MNNSKTPIKDKKSVRTRETIMQAARKVFSHLPYQAASMRMIGKEAGIEHPLINYYFPNKAELFEAVILELCDEFMSSCSKWFDGILHLNFYEGLTRYIDKLLDYNQEHPETMRILALNLAQVEKLDEIPGYQHLPELVEKIRKLFNEKLKPRGKAEDVVMYIDSFNVLVISLLGANTFTSYIHGMNPGSPEYREWVKKTLLYLFYPRLRQIINPENELRD